MDRGRLVELERLAALPKFLCFWGHRPRHSGPGPWVLSQWYPAPFIVDTVRYPTAEHWMMAEKARLFGDAEAEGRILRSSHPGEAKGLGREVRGYDEDRWAAHRVGAVVEGNLAKFQQHSTLRRYLIETGDKVLVEASPTDLIWGVGVALDDPRLLRPREWPGLNLLGFALMTVRDHLQHQE